MEVYLAACLFGGGVLNIPQVSPCLHEQVLQGGSGGLHGQELPFKPQLRADPSAKGVGSRVKRHFKVADPSAKGVGSRARDNSK